MRVMQLFFNILGKVLMLPYGVFKSAAARVVGEERATILTRFLVFVTGGGLGWGLNILVTLLLSRVFGVWQMLAYAIGLVFNISFNFAFHTYITFGKKTHWHRSVVFTIITLAIVASNWLIVYFFVEVLRQNLVATSFIATVALSIVNFTASKLLVFEHKGA